MQAIHSDDTESKHWQSVRPVLDEVIAELKSADRDAVLLRFFSGDGYAALGAKLRISEDAARMRVERALDQLRLRLARRNVTSTAAALATVLSHHAVVAAPPALVSSVSGAALATAASGAWASVFFAMTKLQIGVASLLVIAGTTGFVLQARTNATLEHELSNLQTQGRDIAALRADSDRLAQNAAEVKSLRGDEAEFAQVDVDAAALHGRLKTVAQLQSGASDSGVVGTLDGAPVYDISKLTVKPKPTAQPQPKYPETLKASGVAGNVVLDFVIDSKGNVRNLRALKSTQAEFEAPAIEAVNQWKYSPASKEGSPVHTHVQMTMRFTTDPNEPKHGSH
jgi:TonB family protein